MAAISRDDVAHLAKLARIEMTPAELDHMASELEQILEFIPDGCRWLILGNTHWPMMRTVGATTIINPGSVGQPRNGSNKAQWAVLDTNTGVVTFFEESYNTEALIERLKNQQPLFPKLWKVFETQ